MPLFNMGFKDNNLEKDGFDILKREVAGKLLLEVLVGRSSDFYNRMYDEGLINSSFESDYSNEKQYSFSIMGGESKDPVRVKDEFLKMLEEVKSRGLDQEACNRIKKAMKGRFMRQFNSPERISHTFISVIFKGVNMFDYYDVYDKITFEYIDRVFREHFNPENLSLSVIKPL
jgi:predicted Zn-dependent peptidase